jgi:hypothetical protein
MSLNKAPAHTVLLLTAALFFIRLDAFYERFGAGYRVSGRIAHRFAVRNGLYAVLNLPL